MCECVNCGQMYSVEDVINVDVVVLTVLYSKLGNGWTLSEEVGDGFLFLSIGYSLVSLRPGTGRNSSARGSGRSRRM